MNDKLKMAIIQKAKHLKDVDDCFAVRLSENKGLFIQVIHKEEYNSTEKEYFIELNDVDNDNVYEPCGDYNEKVSFGNIEMLINTIEKYLAHHRLSIEEE